MISVIIVNYHSALQTERAVKSVLQGEMETEVIVVDNTCTTEEREILNEMRGSQGFSLILNNENIGFAKACNQAFSCSKGNYIFLLNPDAFVTSPCLSLLGDFLEKTPSAGSVSPQVYWDDEMRYLFPCYSLYSPFEEFCVRLSSFSQAFRAFYSLSRRRQNLRLWRSSVPVSVGNLHGGAVMVRRSAAEQAGGLFDERFFLFFEDTDLFFRQRQRGYSLYVVPEAKAVHNYSHSRKKLEFLSQMSRIYYEKHFSKSFLLKATSRIPEGPWKGAYHEYGLWDRPPSFSVSQEFQDEGYLFEWSPNPLFIPSIGCFSKDREFALSPQVWNLLDNGRYYSRFTPLSRRILKYAASCWEKKI